MNIFKKYSFYKRVFQGIFITNAIFVCSSVVLGVGYFKTHDVTSLELLLIGLGTFLFGFVLPGFVLMKITSEMNRIRHQSEVMVAKWVSEWFTQYDQFDQKDVIQNPRFWLNMGFTTLEVLGDQFDHPALNIINEFSPIFRSEFKKQSRTQAKKTKSVKNSKYSRAKKVA